MYSPTIKGDRETTYRTYTLVDHAKVKNYSFCLVSWPQEENKLSIVQIKKIVSPSPADLIPDAFCKIKGLVLGTQGEVKAKLDEGEDAVAKPPPRKKACTRKEGAQKKEKGKENKTSQSMKKKLNKQAGRILVVGAQTTNQPKLPGSSTDSSSRGTQLTTSDNPNEQTHSHDQPSSSVLADQQREVTQPQDHLPPSGIDTQKEKSQSEELSTSTGQLYIPATAEQLPSTSRGQQKEPIPPQPATAEQQPDQKELTPPQPAIVGQQPSTSEDQLTPPQPATVEQQLSIPEDKHSLMVLSLHWNMIWKT